MRRGPHLPDPEDPASLSRGEFELLGVPIHGPSFEELWEQIEAAAARKAQLLVLHVNLHGLNLAQEDPRMLAAYRAADVVFCDGEGVRLAARLLGHHLPPRMTGADWLPVLAARAGQRGLRLYLLGSRAGVAERAARRLRELVPGLAIVGTAHGHFDPDEDGPESQARLQAIAGADPDIVIVGLGMPLQERWLAAHRGRLGARVLVSAGAVLDWVSGDLRRPPRWMRRYGLEWLGRLLLEPRRLWRRYLLGIPLFFLRLAWWRLRDAGRR